MLKIKLSKISTLFSTYWQFFAVFLLAGVFFVATSSFNYFTQDEDYVKWLSPDETANYTFAKLYAQTGDIRVYEGYNLYVSDIMHPRSFRSDHGDLKPVSFLGIIIIYGKIASVLGYRVIPYLTPFFGAVGIVFFYLLVKRLFGRRNAFISAFLLASFPPFLYYSARSMFHNVLFTVLLVIALYFAVIMVKNKKKIPAQAWTYAALAGVFTGLAVIVRTSELLWLAPALFLLWLFNLKKVGVTRLVIFLSFLAIAVLPAMYWNQILYGSPYAGGYPEMNTSIAELTQSGSALAKATLLGNTSRFAAIIDRAKDIVFYFGFSPYESMKMSYYYFARMFPWLFVPAVLGVAMYFARVRKIRWKHIAYLSAYLVTSAVLVFYYGSWGFHDNPNPASFTIGNSYTRYWLPVYLGAMPFAAFCLMALTRWLFPKKLFTYAKSETARKLIPRRIILVKGVRVLAVALVMAVSANFVLFGSEEGIAYSARQQVAAKAQRTVVLADTENNSVIVTQYHDKLFFPERKVIVGLFNDENMNGMYAKLADMLPVYYYNFTFPDKDFDYLNRTRLKNCGLQIERVRQVTQDFTLYRLVPAVTVDAECVECGL